MSDNYDVFSIERELVKSIQELKVQKNPVLIITVRDQQDAEHFQPFVLGAIEKLKKNGWGDPTVLLLPPDIDIKTLNDEQMKQCGWVRDKEVLDE